MVSELKIWCEEKPEVGRRFLAYEQCTPNPSVGKMERDGVLRLTRGENGKFDVLVSFVVVDDSTRWCYVPDPPDWDAIAKEGE